MSKPKYVLREINDLKDMLEQTVALHSENDAFIKKTKDISIGVSYKKYKEDVFGLGTELLKRKINGEKVILLSENRYEWCVAFMGSVCSRGVIVPLSPDISEDMLVSRINEVRGKFVIFSEKYRDIIRKIRKKCPTLEYTIDMDTIIDDDENLSLLRLVEIGSKAISSGENEFAKLEIDKDSTAGIFYGNTLIRDKGVMLSHKNLASAIMGIVSFLPISSDDKVSAFLHFSELSHCVCDFLVINNQGGTIFFSEKNKTINENLCDNNPTLVFLSKDLFIKLYNNIWRGLGDMPNIRKTRLLMFFSNILAKFNIDLRKRLFKDILKSFGKNLNTIVLISQTEKKKRKRDFYTFGIDTIQCYDIVEASSIVFINNKREFIKESIIGIPLPGVKACISSSNNKNAGEITLKGDNIMIGYFDDIKSTKKVLEEGILYTRKSAYRDKSGCFYSLDKKE